MRELPLEVREGVMGGENAVIQEMNKRKNLETETNGKKQGGGRTNGKTSS